MSNTLLEVINLMNKNQSIVIYNKENHHAWCGDKESYFDESELYCWWYEVDEMYSTDDGSVQIEIKSTEKKLHEVTKRKIDDFEYYYLGYLAELRSLGFNKEQQNSIAVKNIEVINKFSGKWGK